MSKHNIVTKDQWLAARVELLAKEKAFTRLRDQLSAERRAVDARGKNLRVRRPRRQTVIVGSVCG